MSIASLAAAFAFLDTHSFDGWSWFEFRCGHCGTPTSGAIVTSATQSGRPSGGTSEIQFVVACSHCYGLSIYFGGDPKSPSRRYPAAPAGREVEGLPDDVKDAWTEARAAYTAGAPTASEHMCRKILLHVAVERGADASSSFLSSVNYLFEHGHLPSQMRPWVDRIRLNANKAAHEIEPRDDARARATLEFTQELLHLMYEMDHAMERFAPKSP